MKIYIDSDALPNAVREILLRAGQRTGIPLVFVANRPLKIHEDECISCIVVPEGPDEADDRIVEMVEPGDLVITVDIPLADRVISRGASVIGHRGELYTQENIKEKLVMRDLMAELRDSGIETAGPSALSMKDRQAFANQLDRFFAHRRSTT